MPARRGLIQSALFVGLMLGSSSAVRADDSPFAVRYRGHGRVGVAYAANGLLSCDDAEPSCRGVRSGAVQLQNTQLEMAFIDADPLALGDLDGDGQDDTANSSAAVLDLPDGAQIEFAELYVAGIWRADNANACGEPRAIDAADRTTVRFAPPGEGYSTLDGQLVGDDAQALGAGYAAAFDVSALLEGPGEVWVADAALIEGRCAAGGWALAVAYRTDEGPARSLVLTSGYVPVTDIDLEVALDGLLTPAVGVAAVEVAVGAVEGDRGLDEDGGWLGEAALSDALNPEDDLFNSTISRDGLNVEDRTPAHLNNIAYDFDVLDASGALMPDSRSTTLRITAGRDFVKAFFVGLSADLAVPTLTLSKAASVLEGDPSRAARSGDRVEYVLELQAPADNTDAVIDAEIRDALPVEVAWLPATAEVRRDGGDFAEPVRGEVRYDAANHQLTVRPAGDLDPGEVFTLRFSVEVLPSARRAITNSATATWAGETAGPELLLTARTDSDPDLPGDQPTTIPVAAAEDMGVSDLGPDAAVVDAAIVDARVDPQPDAAPGDAALPDVDAGLDGGPILVDGTTRGPREESLLGQDEDVAGGIIFGCGAAEPGRRGAADGLWGLLLVLLAVRRRWDLAAAVALAALPRPAAAGERFDAQRFAPATDVRHHGLRIMSARPQAGPRWSAGLLFDHADDPLTVQVDGERTRSLVSRQTRAHLLAHGVFHPRFEVGVAVPVMLDAAGDGAVGGPGLGEIRAQGRVVLWGVEADAPTALALVVDGYLGTGDVDAFHGDVERRVDTRFVASHRVGALDLKGNVGWSSRGAAQLGNLEVDDALTLGFGTEIVLNDHWSLLPELDGAVTFASQLDLSEIPFEVLLGARWRVDEAWTAVSALGAGLVPGAGVPDLRFVIGFTYTRPLPEALPPRDAP